MCARSDFVYILPAWSLSLEALVRATARRGIRPACVGSRARRQAGGVNWDRKACLSCELASAAPTFRSMLTARLAQRRPPSCCRSSSAALRLAPA